MEVKAIQPQQVIADVCCDVCSEFAACGYLNARWGYGSRHDGNRYEVQLCESCFFYALTTLKAAKRNHHLFDENFDYSELDNFGKK